MPNPAQTSLMLQIRINLNYTNYFFLSPVILFDSAPLKFEAASAVLIEQMLSARSSTAINFNA